MRRQKKRSGMVKALTITAAIAAISSGAVNAYASQGYEWIQIGPDGNRIQISSLVNNEQYRREIIDAFHAANVRLYVGDTLQDRPLTEWSMTSTSESIFTVLNDDDSPYLPYAW